MMLLQCWKAVCTFHENPCTYYIQWKKNNVIAYLHPFLFLFFFKYNDIFSLFYYITKEITLKNLAEE